MAPTFPFSSNDRLNQQLAFLAELDKLKDILRRSLVGGTRRNENSAEHSWHLAMMSLVLMEHVQPATVNQLRVLKMLLVHDIVEIDAGDTFCYDVAGNVTKAEREQAAALRIFGLLPPDQMREMRALWDEFEAGETLESKWAQGLDRLQPILQNLRTSGASWGQHHVTKAQVLERNKKIGDTMPELWAALVRQIDLAEAQGFFRSNRLES
jgi:putative hydrolase of HD superfamily